MIIRQKASEQVLRRVCPKTHQTVIDKTYTKSAKHLREFHFYQALVDGELPRLESHSWSLPEIINLSETPTHCTITMEDLLAEGRGAHLQGQAADHARAVSAVAALNLWFQAEQLSPRTREYVGFIHDGPKLFASKLTRFNAVNVQQQASQVGLSIAGHLDALLDELNVFQSALDRHRAFWLQLPNYLSHNDLNNGNLIYFAEQQKFVVLDWATVGFSLLGADLAQFILPSFWTKARQDYLDLERLFEREQATLGDYRKNLLQLNADLPVCMQTLRFGFLTRVISQQLLTHFPQFLRSLRDQKTLTVESKHIAVKLQYMQNQLSCLRQLLPEQD